MKTNRGVHALIAVSAIGVLGACATGTRPDAELLAARQAVMEAQNDPAVGANAPLQLDRSRQLLARAEAEWSERGNGDASLSDAYLARQQAAIAREIAREREAEKAIQAATAERERVVLDMRAREADRARAAARTAEQRAAIASAQASNARTQAEAARTEAQTAQAQAQSAQAQAEAARTRNADLQARLNEMSARSTPRGTIVTLGDVLFDVGKSDLRFNAARQLDRLAAFLREYPDRKVDIEGYTDSTGSSESNQTLSEQRAGAVRRALIDRGVAADRIDARGLGEASPVADNATAGGRAMNRRVEVVISGANTPLSAR